MRIVKTGGLSMNSSTLMKLGVAKILASLAAGGPAAAQTSEVVLPVSSFQCLVENRQKYLDLPRNVIIFFASQCPAVSREEVAAIVQNSGNVSVEQETRYIMLKSEFNCLVDQIAAHLETAPGALADRDAEWTFILKCD